jgi:hypothetical protein
LPSGAPLLAGARRVAVYKMIITITNAVSGAHAKTLLINSLVIGS